MPNLDALLSRPGLDPDLRILVDTAVRTWRADWEGLAHTIAVGHGRGTQRESLEETLLQCVLFCGFPRAIAAFGVLHSVWPPSSPPGGGEPSLEHRAIAGQQLFDGVYGPNSESVRQMLQSYHRELHDFVIEEAYGRVLSRPRLCARDREIIAVGALAAMGQIPQLVAHARGAMAFGADRDAIREAMVTALGDTPEIDDHLRRIAR